ncbi:methionine ABC transporter ATP-binding protein [Vallitalea okinawensis]|uniref:methionine ABC transporter ATP-binding protein n=1 Tax=Vallitalea okinawensis TaxID=2078660 RepID=UPI000CFDF7BC|nr:ATP-binding cassette domain-containing protein [Vallitalea okinawensis]
MIRIKNISKEFNNTQHTVRALSDVNLHIESGDIYGIIGLSGAGKSTLVRCINRLEEPTSGEIIINDDNILNYSITQLRELRKRVGMIFQHFNLLSMRTVADNIAYPMEIAKIPKTERQQHIDRLLELVELSDKKHAYPSQLSGGQKQRVGIARALANQPEILLCDEATSALDPKTTRAILNLLKKINHELGLTIIIITHEMDVIKQICNKVAVMEQGKVIEEGETSTVFTHPKHPTTKSFVHHVTHEIPENFVNSNNNNLLIRLNYKRQMTAEPILSYMIKHFNVHANILLGGIDHLQNMVVGNMIIELIGKETDQGKALNYLKEKGVEYEVITS